MYVSFIFAAIFLGYSMGSAPIVGYHYGAGHREELRGLLRKSLILITGIGAVLTAAALVLARPLAMIFVSYDEGLLSVTARALSIYSLSYLLSGYNIYASSFFTALNDGLTSALISFARTLLSDPSILILDEATSSIDVQTEKALQTGLNAMLQGRTSFIIAHRLSTIRDCDRIMYIDDGGILETGTHEELMAKKGHYYKLYTAQLDEVHKTA